MPGADPDAARAGSWVGSSDASLVTREPGAAGDGVLADGLADDTAALRDEGIEND